MGDRRSGYYIWQKRARRPSSSVVGPLARESGCRTADGVYPRSPEPNQQSLFGGGNAGQSFHYGSLSTAAAAATTDRQSSQLDRPLRNVFLPAPSQSVQNLYNPPPPPVNHRHWRRHLPHRRVSSPHMRPNPMWIFDLRVFFFFLPDTHARTASLRSIDWTPPYSTHTHTHTYKIFLDVIYAALHEPRSLRIEIWKKIHTNLECSYKTGRVYAFHCSVLTKFSPNTKRTTDASISPGFRNEF